MGTSPASGQENQQEKISIGPLEKDGDKLLAALEAGHMVAVLSQSEIMYTLLRGDYLCYIHPIGAEEGRAKRLPKTDECRAVIKNLSGLADQLFEIEFQRGMDTMGVMQSAENAIVAFLDSIGQLPAEDIDFMTGDTPS